MIWPVVPVTYWLVIGLIRLCMRVYLRSWSVEGREHVPASGGAILVSNHLNNADPCVIPGVLRRRVVTMAKKEMFRWPGLSLLFRFIGAFPVDRKGADLAALREAQAVLNDGLLLLMFPEGTRSKDRQLHRGFPGSAIIAYRTGAPIVPVAIWGSEHVKWPWVFVRPLLQPKITVRFGEPFYLPKTERVTSEAAKAGTDEIMRRIAALLPEEYRGEYRDAVVRPPATAAAE